MIQLRCTALIIILAVLLLSFPGFQCQLAWDYSKSEAHAIEPSPSLGGGSLGLMSGRDMHSMTITHAMSTSVSALC